MTDTERLVRKIVDEKLNELELKEFAEDTARIVIEIKHKVDDLEELINEST